MLAIPTEESRSFPLCKSSQANILSRRTSHNSHAIFISEVWILSTYHPSSMVTLSFQIVHDLTHNDLCERVSVRISKRTSCVMLFCASRWKYRGVPTLRIKFVENGENLLINLCRLNAKKGLKAEGMLKFTIRGYGGVLRPLHIKSP